MTTMQVDRITIIPKAEEKAKTLGQIAWEAHEASYGFDGSNSWGGEDCSESDQAGWESAARAVIEAHEKGRKVDAKPLALFLTHQIKARTGYTMGYIGSNDLAWKVLREVGVEIQE